MNINTKTIKQMFVKSIDKYFYVLYNGLVNIKEEIKWSNHQEIKH